MATDTVSNLAFDTLIIIGIETAVLLLLLMVWYGLTKVTRKLTNKSERLNEFFTPLYALNRRLAIMLSILMFFIVIAVNTFLAVENINPLNETQNAIINIPAAFWWQLAQALGESLLTILAAFVLTKLLRKGFTLAEDKLKRVESLGENDTSVKRFLEKLQQILINYVWLLAAAWCAYRLHVPEALLAPLVAGIKIYLIIAVGFILVRVTATIVAILESLSSTYASQKSWLKHYETLKPLVPTLRRCIEYGLWVGTATLVMQQITPFKASPIMGHKSFVSSASFLLPALPSLSATSSSNNSCLAMTSSTN